MNKLSFLWVAGLLIAAPFLNANAQTRNCASTEVNARLMEEHPEFFINQQALEQLLANAQPSYMRSSMVVTIPVVFHILYNVNNSTQNVSTARINDQMIALNEDFSASNADISLVPGAFQSVIGNSNIQFCLAQRDPQGNATTGILRKQTSVTSFSDNDAIKFNSQGGDDAWPRDQYLNIWVGNLGGGLLGYAQFPGGPANTDGVVVLNGSVGGPNISGTTGNYDLGRTATHEIGHWLNLRHIWGDGPCGNDFVSDTPTQQQDNGGCPSFPHVTCNNGPNGDMFMNYMDYVFDDCMVMFSSGQSTRMNNSIISSRSALLNSLGCLPPAVPPVAAFQSSTTSACKYGTVTFTDNSTNNPTLRAWLFTGGTPSTSTAAAPVITYNSVGTYDVRLIVTNSAGTDTLLMPAMITVNQLPQVSVTTPGNNTVFCAGSSLMMTANSTSTGLTYQWQRYGVNIPNATAASYNSTQMGSFRVLVTKQNGCSKLSGPVILTKVALPVVQVTPPGPVAFCPGDSVVLTATLNPNWNYTWKKYGNTIAGATTNHYTAKVSGEFKVVVVDTNGCSNSSAKVGVAANCRLADVFDTGLGIYPNPASETIFFSMDQKLTGMHHLTVYDVIGKVVLTTNFTTDGTESDFSVDVNQFESGIYVLVVTTGDSYQSARFVKE